MSSISAVIRSKDARATIDFLTEAFGFAAGDVHEHEGAVAHAEVWHGDAVVMLGGAATDSPAWLYVVVDDPDAHHDRAKAAGAEIVMGLTDQDYGSRDYAAKDIDGNTWNFGTYRPVRPA